MDFTEITKDTIMEALELMVIDGSGQRTNERLDDLLRGRKFIGELKDSDRATIRGIMSRSGIHETIPNPIRKLMITHYETNKCTKCGRCASIKQFEGNTCKKCLESDDPLRKLVSNQCKEAKQRCNKKGTPFDITTDFILTRFEQTGGRCYLCGHPMEANLNSRKDTTAFLQGHPMNISLDQIHPSLGYTKDNIGLTHLRCNLSKRDLVLHDYIQMCKDIAAHHS